MLLIDYEEGFANALEPHYLETLIQVHIYLKYNDNMSEYSTNCKYTASDFTASDVKWFERRTYY